MRFSSLFVATSVFLSTVSSLAVRSEDGEQLLRCDSVINTVPTPSDCTLLVDVFASDTTIVIGDHNRQAWLVLGNCAAVIVFAEGENTITTRANLASKANTMNNACNHGQPFSGLFKDDPATGNDSYCLCLFSNSSITQCA